MKRKLVLACAVLAATMMLQGCETLKGTWKTTKVYYKEYINVDPQVDLEKKDYSSSEEKMSALFTPVDKHMESLSIFLNRQDRLPDEKWMENLFSEYPWVDGFVAATLDGEVVMRRPDMSMKPLNIAPLVETGEALRDRKLRAYVDSTPLGPEVYLGTALFKGNDLAGIMAVHFDMRNLAQFCPSPDELMIFTPDNLLWAGSDRSIAEALFDRPWDALLKEQSSGTIRIDGRQFDWLGRYLGDRQVIYAVEHISGEDEETSSFWKIF
ncbi:hypothetical protein GGQ74_000537 [Desulfobaculum xiamenense]|uniref:Lipoprotein n=1 Tax=Desulfobaculum xiamenense TaxID=995050 RepID=A0A846QIL5_9BACT|nr:hypothetical protein [Desulfobaculum xiamenense]NJB66897.1 hypothetical protein [Desulfobaculum xiamenense]